jgi:hypothetical protein
LRSPQIRRWRSSNAASTSPRARASISVQHRVWVALRYLGAGDGSFAMQCDELLPRQNFPLNLPPNRRLCSTVGERIVEGWTAHCCVASAARSRAATMTNLARSSLALILPALFGAAKSCALVKFSMICPHWSPSRRPTTNQIVLLITAISWHLCEHVEGESRGGRRMQIVRAADDIHRSGMPGSRSAARARAIARSR